MSSTFDADQARNLAIMRMVTAPISIIASATVIMLIARSRSKFSTTQNRLLVGLAVSDIIASLSMTFTSLPMPKGTPNVWLALGNTATCELQGFLYLFGALATPSYNVSLCIFFLLKVRYNVSDETMKRRVEPFLHAFPVLNSFVICLYCLVKEYFNAAASVCYVRDLPRYCSISPRLTCERGEGYAEDWVVRYAVVFMGMIVPIVIFSSMITLFITVLMQEQRMQRYGRGSLNLTPASNARATTSSRQSRYVKMTLYRALAYSLAWLLPWIGISIQIWQTMITKDPPNINFLTYNAVIYPLQGFFNFLVYIYPKVLHERQVNPEYSLFQAFTSALKINMTLPVFWRGGDRRRSHNSMIVRSPNQIVNDGGEEEEEQAHDGHHADVVLDSAPPLRNKKVKLAEELVDSSTTTEENSSGKIAGCRSDSQ